MGSSIKLADLGRPVFGDELSFYRSSVADLLHRTLFTFPGAQPVSFAKHHFDELETKDYYLCEKTDGIRCLLYCTQHISGNERPQELYFLIDRKNDYYAIPPGYLHLPAPGKDIETFHPGTILDGELVLDTMPDKTSHITYLIFDCLTLDGTDITNRTLDVRIGKMKEFVFKPYEEFAKAWPDEVAVQPFHVQLKDMELPYGMEMMFKDRIPNLTHGNDGLIFTCRTTPYVAGTDQHILKWKPPHENTIDFRLYISDFPMAEDDDGPYEDWDAKPEIDLYVNHGSRGEHGTRGYEYFAPLSLTDAEWEAMKSLDQLLDGRIIECFRDPASQQWRPKIEPADGTPRFRDDKKDANHISVVNSVLDSIRDAVGEQDLIDHAGRIRATFKERQAVAAQRRAEEKKRLVAEEQRRREVVKAAKAEQDAQRRAAAAAAAAAAAEEEDDGPRYED